MEFNRLLILWIGLTLVFTQYRPGLISISIGNAGNSSMFTIKAFPDVFMNQTIISANDFNCTMTNGCTTDYNIYNFTKSGMNIQFYLVNVPMNLGNFVNNVTVQVYYLFNDTNQVGSIIGLGNNSTFLNYYYQQNQLNGYASSFHLNSKNEITFGNFNLNAFTVLPNAPYYITIKALHDDKWEHYNGRMCITNAIDNNMPRQTVIGVNASSYSLWSSFVSSTYTAETSKNYISFIWSSLLGFATQMNYLVADFVDGNQNILIQSVSNSASMTSNCDIFTGTLMLQKYDFHLVYSENTNGYQYNYAFNSSKILLSPNPNEKVDDDDSITLFVIIIILIVVAIALLFGYNKYRSNQAERANQEGYISLNIAPIELQEVHRSGT